MIVLEILFGMLIGWIILNGIYYTVKSIVIWDIRRTARMIKDDDEREKHIQNWIDTMFK